MAIEINGKIYRNQQEQVQKNMEDIETLFRRIKTPYHTSSALTDASTSDSRANTNVPADVNEGWLITDDALIFNITGVDEEDDDILLLEFYADAQGPQGPQGEEGPSGSEGTPGANGYSMRYYRDPFVDSGTNYVLAKLNQVTNVRPGDAVLFSDGTLATILTVASTTFTALDQATLPLGTAVEANPTLAGTESDLTGIEIDGTKYKVGGGGSTLYQHNIKTYYSNNGNTSMATLTIINNSDTPFDAVSLRNWLNTNAFNSMERCYSISGWATFNSTTYQLLGIGYYLSNALCAWGVSSTGSINNYINLSGSSNDSFTDVVLAL